MTDLPSDSRATLIERAKAHIRGLLRGADVGRTSDYGMLSAMVGTLSEGLQTQALSSLGNTIATRAGGAFLREHAATLAADTDAVKASGFVIIRSSLAADVVPSGTLIEHADGRRYVVTADTLMPDLGGDLRVAEWCSRWCIPTATGADGAGSTVRDPFNNGRSAYSYVDPESGVTRYIGAYSVGDGNLLFPAPILDEPLPANTELAAEIGALVPVEAETGGAAWNAEAPDTMRFVGSPPGSAINDIHVAWIDGGMDSATDSDARKSAQSRFSERGARSGFADVVRLIESSERYGIRAFVGRHETIPGRWSALLPGRPGRFDVSPIQYHDDPITGAPVTFSLDAALSERQPCGSLVTSHAPLKLFDDNQGSPAVSTSAVVTLRVDRNNRPAWQPGQLTLNGGSTASRLQLNEDPSSILSVGDFICVTVLARASISSRSYVCERRVSAFGQNYVDLDAPLIVDNDLLILALFPGGPAVSRAIEVTRDFYWSQLPSNETAEGALPIYDVRDGYHVGLNEGELAARIAAIPGVLESDVAFSRINGGTQPLSYGSIFKLSLLDMIVHSEDA